MWYAYLQPHVVSTSLIDLVFRVPEHCRFFFASSIVGYMYISAYHP